MHYMFNFLCFLMSLLHSIRFKLLHDEKQGRHFNATIHVARVGAGSGYEREGERCSNQLRLARIDEVLKKATVQL